MDRELKVRLKVKDRYDTGGFSNLGPIVSARRDVLTVSEYAGDSNKYHIRDNTATDRKLVGSWVYKYECEPVARPIIIIK